MPIYEYRCANGHTFELFQRMSDPAAEVCQLCGVGGVEKILFPVAVHFKGSGFYSTDYGKGSRKSTGKDGDSGGGSGDKSGGESSGGEKSGGEKSGSSSGEGGSSSGSSDSSSSSSSSSTSSGSGSSG